MDWRTRLRSLPSGTENDPDSPICSAVVYSIPCIILFLLGCFSTVIFGVMIGLRLGVVPENTGGTIYTLCGVPANFCVGGLIAWLIRKISRLKGMARFVFYSFTAPSFLIFFYLLYSGLEQFLTQRF